MTRDEFALTLAAVLWVFGCFVQFMALVTS